jgi:hypothetical protein
VPEFTYWHDVKEGGSSSGVGHGKVCKDCTLKLAQRKLPLNCPFCKEVVDRLVSLSPSEGRVTRCSEAG